MFVYTGLESTDSAKAKKLKLMNWPWRTKWRRPGEGNKVREGGKENGGLWEPSVRPLLWASVSPSAAPQKKKTFVQCMCWGRLVRRPPCTGWRMEFDLHLSDPTHPSPPPSSPSHMFNGAGCVAGRWGQLVWLHNWNLQTRFRLLQNYTEAVLTNQSSRSQSEEARCVRKVKKQL